MTRPGADSPQLRIERRIGKLYGLGRLALDPNLVALLPKLGKAVDTFADRDTTQP